MFDLQLKLPTTSIQFIHIALQIIAGFWAVVIDGYPCQEQNAKIVTYIAYGLLVLNVVLFYVFHNKYNNSSVVTYISILINLCLLAALFYFTIMGYNNNTCGQSKALYQFFFIEQVITVMLILFIIFGNVFAGQRYSQWPGNLAFAILFLKIHFQGSLYPFALIIGIIYAIISFIGFCANILYGYLQAFKNNSFIYAQFMLSMILMLACQGLAIYVLVSHDKTGDYQWSYCRAVFVIFAAVNIIDFIFCFYGYKKIHILP